MASITIRNLGAGVKEALRVRSAMNGRSMEEEARVILRDALLRTNETRDLGSIFRKHFGTSNGVDLKLPKREPIPEPPTFE
ncbi:MAG: plasmid stabilization protein [Gammaproteobacteria bacterium]|nr:plasmid stabilization protein [Gammaproteobacteria bacterium]